ncbi:MAG: twin-arginine translocase TatA/TatE family subunit [Chloroflexota bacterium]|nr:twin-arginine translocase TatA/TatE family subunit [Chloroflexota bacterium]MDE2840713.1 twin-arginine translocase TatA/TatE family subunit [Chloroflexota bacterium]MDE2931747.1 twin-arginine translocase TatA/TatE family subunit [Chloroflexota bacterium]
MLGTFGWTELLIILVIIVILFGGSRIAGLGGSLGKSIREFRTAMKEEQEEPSESDGEKKADSSADSGEKKEDSGQSESEEKESKKS